MRSLGRGALELPRHNAIMKASFTAYIDESGDEGFVFLPNEQGSSRWFVLSAAVFRSSNALAPVIALKEARETLKKEAKKPLHFRELRHEQRVAYVNLLAKQQFRTISIASYKPDIQDPERYQKTKHLLYRYLTRLLLERISWLCRDNPRDGDGDGCVDLVFSDRAAMSYEDLKRYIDLLREQSANGGVNIHWPTISPENIRAVAHAQLAGLQVADAVASSTFFALHRSVYGYAEPAYANVLKGHVYRHKNRRLGYGLKFLSDFEGLKKQMPHVGAAFGDW